MSNIDDYDHPNHERGSAALESMAANDDSHDLERPRSPAEVLEPARAPEPPRGHRRQRTHPVIVLMNGAMSLLVIGSLGLGALFYFAKLQFNKPGSLNHSTVFVIPRGEGVTTIAERLERDGIISDRRIFVATAFYFKALEKLKAGEYEIRKNSSMRDVLDKLVEGKAVLYKVSIPEGLTSQQIVERLNAHKMLKGKITEIPAEGTLLPDTYKFSRGISRQDLLERMKAEQRKYVSRLWPKRQKGLPVKTPEEAIILASIVEKETGRADERSRVAGVFVNRLNKGIPLQSDPTIIYGLVGGKGKLGRGILRSELAKETPYNTYKIKGLTPTPIANPGRAAIEAVLNPAKTNDLFFVADGTGGHAFAPSLAKHNQNVAVWRKIERRRREKAAAKKAAAEALASAALAQPSDASADQMTVPAGVPETTSVLSGITGQPDPGGISGDIIEGLSIKLPMADGGVSLPVPEASQPTAALPTATLPTATLPTDTKPDIALPAARSAETVPMPKRKPKL